MRISTALLVLSLVTWLPVSAATAYTITLNGFATSTLNTQAVDAYPYSYENVSPASLPYSYTSTTVDEGASSESEYDLSNSVFNITFDHSRTSTDLSNGLSVGFIYFSVDENIDYVASGSYAAVDPEGRYIYFEAFVYDNTNESYAFQSIQYSRATPNESFALGGTGGDFSNTDTGSLTGTLIAGHDYYFHYNVGVREIPAGSTSGATASGNISLSFTPVPEPSTALLMSLGMVGLGMRRRR